MVARAGVEEHSVAGTQQLDAKASLEALERKLRWLERTVAAARELAAKGPMGIFGTSIAATWLAAELEGAAAFFVDEDAAQVDKRFMDRPVLHPLQLQAPAEVFVALPPELAESVAKRLQQPGITYHAPPAEYAPR